MGKKPPPKLSAEEKAAAAQAKLNEALHKACKNDERAKAEEALTKGADVAYVNDVRGPPPPCALLISSDRSPPAARTTVSPAQKGHNAAHIAAAFGALQVLRLLYSKDVEIFHQQNAKKMTALEVAVHIGEEDARLLIEALLEGRDDGTIGLGEDLELDEDDAEGVERPMSPADTARSEAAEMPAAGPSSAGASSTTVAPQAVEVL